MVKAVFAGSFDPPTNGHLDIIKRASGLFESVDVVVSVNPEKKTMFSEEERVEFLKDLIKPFKNVSVHSYKGIIVNYAKEVGAKVLVRGVRSANDFGYEFELALMNQNLNPDIETVFLQSKEKYTTCLGGIITILFIIFALIIGIFNLIPFYNRKNFTAYYYTLSTPQADMISFSESKTAMDLDYIVGQRMTEQQQINYLR